MANLSVSPIAMDPMKSIEPRGVGAMANAATGSQSTTELGDTFTRMFDEVNNLQNEADRKIEEFATSPDKDIHGTMIALQKADLSLKLMMQIRAKLTAAYQDVMRMQL
jgi:flagellar hook-basal body complex protein FliE